MAWEEVHGLRSTLRAEGALKKARTCPDFEALDPGFLPGGAVFLGMSGPDLAQAAQAKAREALLESEAAAAKLPTAQAASEETLMLLGGMM